MLDAAVARCSRTRSDEGLRTPRALRALRRGCQGVEASTARPPDRASGATGKQVVGYGAPGKGNTLLNYCGIRTDLLDYTVDRNPHKQGTLHAGHAHPDPRAESIAETSRTTSSSCRGT